jgi:hypothetical protein
MEKCYIIKIGQNGSTEIRCLYCGVNFKKKEAQPQNPKDKNCKEQDQTEFFQNRALARSADT